MGIAAAAFETLVNIMGEAVKRDILSASLFRILYNGEWGFRTLERLHYIWGFCLWDLFSSITYFIVNKGGVTCQVWPYGGWAVLSTLIGGTGATNMALLYSAFVGTYGWGRWVYMGAYLPIRQLTSYEGKLLDYATTIASVASVATPFGIGYKACAATGIFKGLENVIFASEVAAINAIIPIAISDIIDHL